MPYRAKEAEKVLNGSGIDKAICGEAARAAVSVARPMTGNRYKVELTRNLIRDSLLALLEQT